VAHADPKAILAVVPSDQHVADLKAFRATLDAAAQAAAQDYIVTLGITPTRPDTGYGYIQVGESLGAALRVQKFVEKPDRATAEKYLAAKTYVWNAGMFVFQAQTMLRAFEKYMPDLFQPLMALKPTVGTARYAKALKKYFPQMPATSIDYGIAERADNMAVVPGNFGWSDVGSFDALPEVRQLDDDGNVVEGSAVVVDSRGCVVLGGKRLLAVVGMQDAVVVDSDDAVLVLPKSSSQNVRKVVERLKANHKLKRYL
jgi:mannose-1-phosphate guanylyltransferase